MLPKDGEIWPGNPTSRNVCNFAGMSRVQGKEEILGKLSVHHFEREALIKLHLEYIIKRLLHHRASDVKIIEPNTGGPQESLNEHSERKNYV